MPFERSVRLLLQFIQRSLAADTVALKASGESSEQSHLVALLPLASQRTSLEISWRGTRPDVDLAKIQPLVEALNLLLERIEQTEKFHQLRREAANLEWELADHKIADRSAGMLASGEEDLREVREHVLRVLEPVAGIDTAAKRLNQIKAELAHRGRLSAAKQLLQTRHGLTEQQAYLHLQRESRRARRTISEMASEILAAEDLGNRRIA